MSDDVEEITKTPAIASVAVESNVKTKEKDPKKVAAGKKLAEYNRKAKETLKEKMKREAEKIPEEDREQGSHSGESWIPEISFTTAISVVGIGLTAINMFMSYKKDTKVDPPCEQIESTILRPLASRLPEPEPSKPSKIPVPKMGMH